MFAASRYITYARSWTERGRIMKSGDGADRFHKDLASGKLDKFLLKCLFFTLLEPQNHIREFIGSDKRHYKNQLCLDITNGETLAYKALKKMVKTKGEKALLKLWNDIIIQAKKTANYQHQFNYGLYQIKTELNTTHIDQETGKNVPDYIELNGYIETLASLVKDYYLQEIVPTLFDYEFLK